MKIARLLVLGTVLAALCMAVPAYAQPCLSELSDSLGPTGGSYEVGETIEYVISISVPASGGGTPNCTLTNVRVYFFPVGVLGAADGPCNNLADPDAVLIASGLTLTPGAAPLTYDSSDNAALQYTVQLSDVGNQMRAKMAVVFDVGDGSVISDECDEKSSVNLAIAPLPCIEITKDVDCDVATVGAEVTYTYCIHNCGTLALEVTALDDDVVGDLLADFYAANGDSYLLAADDEAEGGDDEVCFTVQYTILDTDDDPLINEVRVDAVDQYEQAVYDEADAQVDIVHPDFTVTKVCLTDPVPDGEDAEFEITIENTGDVDLVVTLNEDVLDDQQATITAGTEIALADGATLVYTVVLPVIEGDVSNEVLVCAELPEESDICVDPELFPICKSASDTCSVQGLCYGDETAWAYGYPIAIANWDVLEKSKNWGWTNGPLPAEGTYTWDLYAGAGQNILSNGEVVGTVTVDYADGCVEVTYEVDPGYYLGEAHLWIGNTPLPLVTQGKKSVPTDAPGQFPYGVNYGFDPEDSSTWQTEWSSGEICDLEGDIYVAAHAVVWMEVECPPEICDNGIDDDRDGLTDLEDTDCQPQ